MNILLVTAHDDPKSFTATLHNTALSILERTENKVLLTELHAQQFNPISSILDFKTSSGGHTDYIFEQLRAVNTGTGFSPDIQAEMDKVTAADLIVFHFPLRWHEPPAMLKGWLERILAMGFAWNADARYSKGMMRGKKALVVCNVGDPESFYSSGGMHKATVEQHLFGLLHGTLAFCGFDVLQPYVITNTTAGSREEIEAHVQNYKSLLEKIDTYDEFIYKHGD